MLRHVGRSRLGQNHFTGQSAIVDRGGPWNGAEKAASANCVHYLYRGRRRRNLGYVGSNPLVHVSTIHSFMWMIVRPFQNDIRQWIKGRIREKLDELRQTAANFGPRVQQRTRDKNRRDVARYELEQTRIDQAKVFTYGTGSDYPRGVLGHDDILRISTQFLTERKLFDRF